MMNLPAILGGTPLFPAGPPTWPLTEPAALEELTLLWQSGDWGRYHGSRCEELTRRLASYQQCEFVTLCSSGTVAMELALRGANVAAGDEVILAGYEFKANFTNVLHLGATPVLTDLRLENWQLDPNLLAAAITPRTRAVIVSHLHGGVGDVAAVLEVVRGLSIAVIEDACQMTGGLVRGQRAGSGGDVGLISFGGSKLLTAGRGGAVFTNDATIAQRIKLTQQRGNLAYPLSELQAAVLLPQLALLDERNRLRSQNVERLRPVLAAHGLTPLRNDLAAEPAYYKLGVQFQPDHWAPLTRDRLAAALRAEGLAFDPGFRALHRTHSQRRCRIPLPLPVSETADERCLVLHHPALLEEPLEIDKIGAALARIRLHAAEIAGV